MTFLLLEGDDEGGATSFARTASDTAPATDAATRSALLDSRSASDSAPATDAATVSRTRTATDSAPAIDSVSALFSVGGEAFDDVSVSETALENAPPQNDDIANAFDLGTSAAAHLLGDNQDATEEDAEPNNSVTGDRLRTVWHKWQPPPGATSVTVDTAGSAVNTTLAAFTAATSPIVVEVTGPTAIDTALGQTWSFHVTGLAAAAAAYLADVGVAPMAMTLFFNLPGGMTQTWVIPLPGFTAVDTGDESAGWPGPGEYRCAAYSSSGTDDDFTGTFQATTDNPTDDCGGWWSSGANGKTILHVTVEALFHDSYDDFRYVVGSGGSPPATPAAITQVSFNSAIGFPALEEVAADNDSQPDGSSTITFAPVAGETYYFQTGSAVWSLTGALRLNLVASLVATIIGGPVLDDAVIPGGYVRSAAATPPTKHVRAHLYERDAVTLVRELVPADPPTFLRQLSETGSGNLALAFADASIADAGDRVIRWSLAPRHGTEADRRSVFQSLVESMEHPVRVSGEEHDQTAKLSGRGIGALLEEMTVYPALGLRVLPDQQTRRFDFTSVLFDDSTWGSPVDFGPLSTFTTFGAYRPGSIFGPHPGPARFPNGAAHVIWGTGATVDDAPKGDCFGRRWFYVPQDGVLSVAISTDDWGTAWLDEQELLSSTNRLQTLTETYEKTVDVTAGWHLMAVKSTNQPFTGPNVAGFTLDASLLVPGQNALSVLVSDVSWKWLTLPAVVPGMTPGRIIRLLIHEAQLRGCLPTLTLSFTDTRDSNGVAWPITTNIGVRVGTDMLSVMRQLAASYIDWSFAPTGLRLDAYNIDSLGQPQAGAALHHPNNLAGLTYKTEF